MEYIYKPKGVCSNLITIELDGEIIRKVEFMGGCSGNGRGISQLVKGRNAKEVIRSLRGVRCGTGKTSCPISCHSLCNRHWSKKNSERGEENALDCFSSRFRPEYPILPAS